MIDGFLVNVKDFVFKLIIFFIEVVDRGLIVNVIDEMFGILYDIIFGKEILLVKVLIFG